MQPLLQWPVLLSHALSDPKQLELQLFAHLCPYLPTAHSVEKKRDRPHIYRFFFGSAGHARVFIARFISGLSLFFFVFC